MKDFSAIREGDRLRMIAEVVVTEGGLPESPEDKHAMVRTGNGQTWYVLPEQVEFVSRPIKEGDIITDRAGLQSSRNGTVLSLAVPKVGLVEVVKINGGWFRTDTANAATEQWILEHGPVEVERIP